MSDYSEQPPNATRSLRNYYYDYKKEVNGTQIEDSIIQNLEGFARSQPLIPYKGSIIRTTSSDPYDCTGLMCVFEQLLPVHMLMTVSIACLFVIGCKEKRNWTGGFSLVFSFLVGLMLYLSVAQLISIAIGKATVSKVTSAEIWLAKLSLWFVAFTTSRKIEKIILRIINGEIKPSEIFYTSLAYLVIYAKKPMVLWKNLTIKVEQNVKKLENRRNN